MNVFKAIVKSKVTELIKERTNDRLGSLGPCTFEPVEEFFNNVPRAESITLPDFERVVVSGDVHGDLVVLLGNLFMAKVIDESMNFTAKKTNVLFLGDIIDRSGRDDGINDMQNTREEIDIIQYLYYLDRQARDMGEGSVTSVIGNHEVMNVLLRMDPKKWDSYAEYQNDVNLLGWGGDKDKSKLFKPGGAVATYFADRFPLILRHRDNIFLHAGFTYQILERFQNSSDDDDDLVAEINSSLKDFLLTGEGLDRIDDLIWTRQLADFDGTANQCKKNVEQSLRLLLNKSKSESLKDSYVFIGHTIQDTLKGYCGNYVIRLDVGASEAFGNSDKLAVAITCRYENKIVVSLILSNYDGKYTCVKKSHICHHLLRCKEEYKL